MNYIRSIDGARCRTIWNGSDRLAELNWRRFQDMNLTRALTPAILSYEGLQYQ